MLRSIFVAFALLLCVSAQAQQPGLTGPGPAPGVPASGGKFTGQLQQSFYAPNSTPAGTLAFFGDVQNTGPSNGVGWNWDWTTVATSGGFDINTQAITNVIVPTPSNSPTWYGRFDWILGPSSISGAWGLGAGELDITNRVLTSPGWARDRSNGPQNTGGWLVVPIATSSFGQTIVNPFTTNGTTTVTVTFPGTAPKGIPHMLQAGETVQFSGAGITACNGFTPANPSTYTVLSVVDAFNFTINGGATSGSGTCGGSVFVKEFNGQDIRYAYSVAQASDQRGLDGRQPKTYIPYNCEPGSTVGVTNDPTGHGGNCFYGTGARQPLGNNPVTTTGTTTVNVAWPNSGLATTGVNNTFNIVGASNVGGYNPNGLHTVTAETASTVSYVDAGASGSNTTGGGGSMIVYNPADVPRAIFECDGYVVNCFRSDAANPTGNVIQMAAGQTIGYTGTGSVGYQGSNTNDNAATGAAGEYVTNSAGNGGSATVTITIAAPGIITDTAHGMVCLTPVYLSTSGALPTGLSAFTGYYVSCGTVTANTYQISTTMANALAGTSITTTGSQSGTQTIHRADILNAGSGAPSDVVGVQLTAGDWDCEGTIYPFYGGATSVTMLAAWLGTAGASVLPYTLATPIPTAATLTSGLNIQTMAAIVTPAISETTQTTRISLSAAGMVVLSMQATYTVSSMTASGVLRCRRPR